MQKNSWRQNLLAVLLLLAAAIFDGFLMSYWTSGLSTNFGLMVPRTVVLLVIILSFHYDEKFILPCAPIIGFLLDSYYVGFVGPYMVSLLLVAYLTLNIKTVVQPNLISYTLVSILGITLVEVLVFSIMKIFGITTISLQIFLVSRLGATLFFNGLLMLVFSYFIDRLIVYIMDES